MKRRAAVAAGGLILLVTGLLWLRPGTVVVVEPGTPLAGVLRAGVTVELAPGRHEPFTVDVPATVRGHAGAVVAGGIVVTADGARLQDLTVAGGQDGITVRGARDVVITGAHVSGVTMHGIEVVEATATIRDCRVTAPAGRYVQGVEVRNSAGLGRTVVEGCTVAGGQEGLVAHVSRVELRGNDVAQTTMRAIAVTEMSEGLVSGNRVHDVTGAGVYCGDMSHCEVTGNLVHGVRAHPGGARSLAGHAVAAWYYSTVRVLGNDVDVDGQALAVNHGSVSTGQFPLSIWPAGWRGSLGVVPAAAGWLALLGLAWAAAGRATRRWLRPAAPKRGSGAVLLTLAAIQGFHQFEHLLQVWQVTVADAEVRTGLLGAAVDNEWLHLAFNSVVLLALVIAVGEVRAMSLPGATLQRAGRWLLATVAVQGYHLAEHVAKISQHVALGIDPAPGLLGARVGLVAFHMGINLAVTVGLLAACTVVLRATPGWRPRLARVQPARS